MADAQSRYNILIDVSGRLDGLDATNRGLRETRNEAMSLRDVLRQGLGFGVGAELVQFATRLPGMFAEGIKAGIQFNSTIETAQIGIAAVLKQFDAAGKYPTFAAAMNASAGALDYLTEKAKKSPATLQELVQAYQGTAGAMAAAGLTVKQQVDLIAQMSQTLGGLGIRSEQILQESRALITGNINADAAAAKILGITAEQITSVKAKGQLYDFLMGKMSAFATASDFSANTLTQLWSNTEDAFDQYMAKLSEPIFEELKKGIAEIMRALESSSVDGGMKQIAEQIATIAKACLDGAVFMIKYAGTIVTLGEVFAETSSTGRRTFSARQPPKADRLP
jgi:hypothetical protein